MWKDIYGFEGYYQIDEYGNIRSLDRVITDSVGHMYTIYGRVMRLRLLPNGYLMIDLRKYGKVYRFYIHTLVAEHFIGINVGYPKYSIVVNHKDGNKLNNHYTNLEYTTYSGNNQHAYDHNLKAKGENFYNAKLTNEQVIEIKKNGKGNKTFEEIASRYNVNKATIYDILSGKTWKHINV